MPVRCATIGSGLSRLAHYGKRDLSRSWLRMAKYGVGGRPRPGGRGVQELRADFARDLSSPDY